MRFLAVLAFLVAGSACSSDSVDRAGPETRPAAEPRFANAPVRRCDERVSGDLGRDWRDSTILVGPIGLVASFYDRQPTKVFAPLRNGVYASQKVLVLVRRGTTATLVVPREARGVASLLYARAKWKARNAYRLSEGDVATIFEACEGLSGFRPHEYTQFNGGIVVAGARCVPLDVYAEGSDKPLRAVLSFGAGRCG
jgi:hypothetical protein